jgi:hypothetical protein
MVINWKKLSKAYLFRLIHWFTDKEVLFLCIKGGHLSYVLYPAFITSGEKGGQK